MLDVLLISFLEIIFLKIKCGCIKKSKILLLIVVICGYCWYVFCISCVKLFVFGLLRKVVVIYCLREF